ncbi:hypothetical protein BB561_003029 [Smittium simulii]|uniref:ACT domain-containing protein n=1 Tax=Smittium simulii TaxID=133385 RepID=A0A2T9YN97_9FUNG|nr:hypothetical protein BB561_003029 [Smittium simulii]
MFARVSLTRALLSSAHRDLALPAARFTSTKATANSNVTDSSTTALEYKDGSIGKIKPIPGVLDTLTAQQAVSQLLETTPLAPRVTEERYIIDCLAQDEPGVLSSVTGIMAARGFSIDTLIAGKTEVNGLSRMTIGLKGPRQSMEQAIKQLESLIPVWAVLDYSNTKIVERESLLVKLTLHGLQDPAEKTEVTVGADPARTVELLEKRFNCANERLVAIKNLTLLFNAKVCDVGPDSVVIEMCAKSSRVDSFLKLVRPFGILEAVRSGVMVMARSLQDKRIFGSTKSDIDSAEDAALAQARAQEELANLPPS